MLHTHDPRVLILKKFTESQQLHKHAVAVHRKPSEHIFSQLFPASSYPFFSRLCRRLQQTITRDTIPLLAVVIQLDVMPHVKKENLRKNFFFITWLRMYCTEKKAWLTRYYCSQSTKSFSSLFMNFSSSFWKSKSFWHNFNSNFAYTLKGIAALSNQRSDGRIYLFSCFFIKPRAVVVVLCLISACFMVFQAKRRFVSSSNNGGGGGGWAPSRRGRNQPSNIILKTDPKVSKVNVVPRQLRCSIASTR